MNDRELPRHSSLRHDRASQQQVSDACSSFTAQNGPAAATVRRKSLVSAGVSLAVRSLWQAPLLLNPAKAFKHPFVLFVDSVSFRYTEKLNQVSVGAMKYHKRIRVISPMPMLAEIPHFVGCWRCRANGVRGDIGT
jgi:hypothetical protein